MRFLKEPLVHFVLIGALLFVVFQFRPGQGGADPKRIVVTPGQAEQLAGEFAATWMRAPMEKELDNLIKEQIRDEVCYREALALGLDQGDRVIQKRLRQKLEFLLDNLAAEESPGEEKLAAFLAANPEKFGMGAQVSFQQIYLNPDKHKDVTGDAERILDELRSGADPETLGDATIIPPDYELVTRIDIARQFGDEFAAKVAVLEPGDWTGPIGSGYGAHLVKVARRVEGRTPGLDEVRSQVEREWLVERQKELKDAAFARLLEGYEIVIETKPEPAKIKP